MQHDRGALGVEEIMEDFMYKVVFEPSLEGNKEF